MIVAIVIYIYRKGLMRFGLAPHPKVNAELSTSLRQLQSKHNRRHPEPHMYTTEAGNLGHGDIISCCLRPLSLVLKPPEICIHAGRSDRSCTYSHKLCCSPLIQCNIHGFPGTSIHFNDLLSYHIPELEQLSKLQTPVAGARLDTAFVPIGLVL